MVGVGKTLWKKFRINVAVELPERLDGFKRYLAFNMQHSGCVLPLGISMICSIAWGVQVGSMMLRRSKSCCYSKQYPNGDTCKKRARF
jgi:hypothetical protein